MKKLFIFDMDGVIINSEPIYLKANIEYFKSHGFNVSEKEYHSFVGLSAEKMWHRIKTKYSLKEDLSYLVKSNNSYIYDVFSKEENLKAINGISELLSHLRNKNLKIAIGSSSSLKMINLIVNRLNIHNYFDYILSGEFVKKGKPEPDIFLKIAEHFNYKPDECIVIEDSFNGVSAAKNAGMDCVAYKNYDSGNQDLSSADLIIEDFGDNNMKKIMEIIDL